MEAAITDVCGNVASLMDQSFEHCSEGGSNKNPVDRLENYIGKCRLMITNLYSDEKGIEAEDAEIDGKKPEIQ